MMRHAWLVFRKDGLEILRDRRTLFVNLLLPVLLYPLLVLFLAQAAQLAQAQPLRPARLAAVDAEPGLAAALRTAAAATTGAAMRDAIELAEVDPALAARLRRHAGGLADVASPPPARAEVLAELRAAGLVGALVALPADPGRRLLVLIDDAAPRAGEVEAAAERAAAAWRRQLVAARLAAVGLPESVLDPLSSRRIALAPAAETVRTRLAAVLPLLLVMLAAMGAFWPAVDVLAGERERGTLETLMAWPAERRAVFLGKLAVVAAAALASVALNLLSFALTAALVAGQALPGEAGIQLSGLLSVGGGSLLLCLAVLLPVVVAVSAAALLLSGLSASVKEAQNHLSPLLIAVMAAAAVALIPRAAPSIALDLIPVAGAVLALKEALQSPALPWGHLLLATAASAVVAAVAVALGARLMEDERFRYPGLVRAGWGRWRRWGAGPAAPGGLEVLAVYAVAVAGMTLGGGLVAGAPPLLRVLVPLAAFVALPAVLHAWAGAYPRPGLFVAAPQGRHLAAAAALLPTALALSLGLGALQGTWMPAGGQEAVERQVREVLAGLREQGGIAALLLAVAVAPALCEELLCRGTLLAGLRRSLGAGAAIWVSAFLFAALHLSPYRFVPQLALGALLAWLTLRSGSLLPAMLLHALHNGVLVGAEALAGEEPWAGWGAAMQARPFPWLVGGAALAALGAWAARAALAVSRPRP